MKMILTDFTIKRDLLIWSNLIEMGMAVYLCNFKNKQFIEFSVPVNDNKLFDMLDSLC